MEQLAAYRAAQRAKWQREADAVMVDPVPSSSSSARACSTVASPVRSRTAATQDTAVAKLAAELQQPGDSVGALSKRIFDRLVKDRTKALQAVPFVPQTIMDLLEDAPEREPAKLSSEDVARARMEALRGAHEALEPQDVEAKEELFRVLSWNIDGLDEHQDLPHRVEGVVSTIFRLRPAVVFLQEVVDAALTLLRAALGGRYEVVLPKPRDCPYYVAVLVSRLQVREVSAVKTVPFQGSRMGRQVLVLDAALRDGRQAALLTSHLESTKECSKERQAQFQKALEIAQGKTASGGGGGGDGGGAAQLVVFGGDLNLRDPEAKPVLAKFPKIQDVWQQLGSDKASQFTWDSFTNDNCGIARGPRCRFDRMYCAGAKPVAFELVGKDRLEHGRFASDHWGMLATWDLQRPSSDGEPTLGGEKRQAEAATLQRFVRRRLTSKASEAPPCSIDLSD
eukprot:TRINITY_DN36800_c0_g1_i1.p1 TRINITY_DN36800_c0_g1~~TRINITY_DN36800_c0_g1_i1.p1  ORF type:complete len:480 (-),score=110.90 TRINITY_DN36800_c0_g1_i1:87-1442(-)